MINKRTLFEIHRLKDMQFSIRQIAKTLNLDRGTVSRYIEHPDIARKSMRGRPSKLDHFWEDIKEMVDQYPRVKVPVVLREISGKGFDGEITILREYLRALRYNVGGKQAFIRFESQPGQQIQIDWGHFGSLVYGGTVVSKIL